MGASLSRKIAFDLTKFMGDMVQSKVPFSRYCETQSFNNFGFIFYFKNVHNTSELRSRKASNSMH